MRNLLLTIAFLAVGTSAANAQNYDLEICRSIVQYGTFDVFNNFTDQQDFSVTRHLVCRDSMTKFDSARSIETTLNIPITETLRAAFGQDVNESNYREAREKFCLLDYAQASSSDQAISQIRKASATISQAFNKCIFDLSSQNGFFGYITPGRDKAAFAVNISYRTNADQTYNLTGISSVPVEIECSNNEQDASRENPVALNGTQTILCKSTDPNKSLLIAVNTDKGDIRGPDGSAIQLAGRDETLSDLQRRVTALESRAVQSGEVAYYATPKCPSGWSDYARAEGRYVVGLAPTGNLGEMVGRELAPKENRAVGRHRHDITLRGIVHNGDSRDAIITEFYHRSNVKINVNIPGKSEWSGNIPDTNAPYVQLKACVKD